MVPMRGFFGGKKPTKQADHSFRAVVASGWIAKYHGTLPATPGCRHSLICSEINRDTAQTLLAEGFRPVAGTFPTHGLFCTVALAKDNYQFRALFNLYLDLTSVEGEAWRSWVAIEVCRGLKQRLLACKERALLIRCRTESEFLWCLDDRTLDFNWLDDGNRYLRSALQEYESIKQV